MVSRLITPSPLPVYDRAEYLDKLQHVVEPMVKVHAMYNSLVGGIVRDAELMTIPIHDHAIVRGHACFDTCTVVNGRLYRVDIHLDRHLASIVKARIPLPFQGGVEENKTRMRDVVARTVVVAGLRDASVRYYTSVGPGNFGVSPTGCTSAFYVVVYAGEGALFHSGENIKGISEFTVTDVPIKPQLLATIKSNNYMLNVLTAMSSQDRGGSFGIMLDENGNIAESCVLNCTFVTADGRFITPPFNNILAGTTVRKALDFARTVLVQEGLVKSVSQEAVPLAVAKQCVEMLMLAGDHHLMPVTRWDNKPVGNGQVGKVSKRLMDLISAYAANGGTDDHYTLDYGVKASL